MKEFFASKTAENYDLFLKNFENPEAADIEYFHPFQCPVAEAKASVEERHIQDYSVFSLLALRLISIGFGTVEQIEEISGLSQETVVAFFNRAIVDNHCQYIDPQNPDSGVRLTPLGEETLAENENTDSSSPKAHLIYNTPRKLQIEAATCTVIPSFMERQVTDSKPDEDAGDFILPIKTVDLDEELLTEIKERIREYIDLDYIKSGDVVQNFKDISSVHIFFRWAYLTKIKGMKYPMIVMTGKRQVENLNAKSKKSGKFDWVAAPVSISETDAKFLKSQSIEFSSTLIRSDHCFEYLANSIKSFSFEKQSEQNIGGTNTSVTPEETVKTDVTAKDGNE